MVQGASDLMDLVSIGLVLDIVGVILLFFYGLPNNIPAPSSGTVIVWPGGEANESEKEEYRKELKKYKRLSRLGIILLLVGFGLQLIGNIFSSCSTLHCFMEQPVRGFSQNF